MATAEHIKSLIYSHYSNDAERFHTVALQLAAYEARKGHSSLAHDIRNLIDKNKKTSNWTRVHNTLSDLKGLVLTEASLAPLQSMVLPSVIGERLKRVIHEYRQKAKLKAHGLEHRRKLLLVGPPGTGKTLTAKVLAHELSIPLHTIQVDRLVTKFMGETSAKLRQIFDLIQQEHAIYLFDEFDAIGGDRTSDNEVGEMRRVLNSFLQFIEQDKSESLIIAATNNAHLLDHALFRRFDDVLSYEYPEPKQIKSLVANVLGVFKSSRFSWKKLLPEAEGLSHAEIDHACRDAIKYAVLSDKSKITASQLLERIIERQSSHKGTRG